MVIDASAMLAILLGELEEEAFLGAILAAPTRVMPPASAVEAALVLQARKGPAGVAVLWKLLHACGVTVLLPANEQPAADGGAAPRTPGDRAALALAAQRGEPLLTKRTALRQAGVRLAL